MESSTGLMKLEGDSFKDLTEMLMDDWPRSAPVIGMIKQSQRSAGQLITFNVYVDSWPQTQMVILENLTYKRKDEIKQPPLLVYTRHLTAEQIKEKLTSIPLLKRCYEEGNSEFQFADYRIYETLKDAACQHGFRVLSVCPFIYSIWDKALRSEVPTGYRISCLEPIHANFINANWKFGGTPHMLQRIKAWIQNSASAGAFCSHTNELVSWGVISEAGCISALQTQDSHRGKGLAKAVVADLIRQAEEEKMTKTFVLIEEENLISRNLFEKIGFRKCQEGKIFFCTIVP